LVQEAIALWDQSPYFDLRYVKVASEAAFPSNAKNAVFIVEREQSADALTTPSNAGSVSWWRVEVSPTPAYDWALDPSWLPRDPAWFMRRTIRHEIGHTLTLGHHNAGWSSPTAT